MNPPSPPLNVGGFFASSVLSVIRSTVPVLPLRVALTTTSSPFLIEAMPSRWALTFVPAFTT
ncbi:MAG: hypothetical protein QOD91_2139 [Frankiales bacterium]|nr:hypothetical protein [Frankiales bacterium]